MIWALAERDIQGGGMKGVRVRNLILPVVSLYRHLNSVKISTVAVILLIAVLFVPTQSWGWGTVGHEKILQAAVGSLAGSVGQYFQTYKSYLTTHVMDPDIRKRHHQSESPRHYFDMEEYVSAGWEDDTFPDTQIVRSGILPWAVIEAFDALTAHLHEREYESAAKSAADLGHYVGDMFQPLHTTNNHDGQLTGNDGIHKRYEISLAEGYRDMLSIRLSPLKISKNNLAESVMTAIKSTHNDVAVIMDADRSAKKTGDVGSVAYYQEMSGQITEEISGCMSRAASFLSTLYRLAWEEAGLPVSEEKELAAAGGSRE